jgi:DNA gyrase subunit B
MTATKKYDSSSIVTLKGLEAVRKRPTMYIGTLGVEGCFHLFREIFDNCLDEFMGGWGKTIWVSMDKDGRGVTVRDEGRGIPVDNGALEHLLTTLHSGGKFEEGAYATSAGLNGVGSSCVNALSDVMDVTVFKDGFVWKQSFSKGVAKGKIVKGEPTKKSGTTVHFVPDVTIMEEVAFDIDRIRQYCDIQAYLNAGLKVVLNVDGKTEEFHHPQGLIEYVEHLNKQPMFKTVASMAASEQMPSGKPGQMIHVEVAIGYSKGSEEEMQSFCNSIPTTDGGTHVQGFRMSQVTIIKNLVKELKILGKKDEDIEIKGEDVREGLVAIVSVKHPDPKYKGQTKHNLGNQDVQGIVQRLLNAEFKIWLDAHPEEAKIIAKKCVAAAKARVAANRARTAVQRKESLGFAAVNNVGKLADCTSTNAEECELFMVEGDSAGGSAKSGRDPRVQAIYALRGKPLNSNDVQVQRLLDNKELSDLLTVMGCGYGEHFDVEKRKYHKIVIMTDADVDGAHIAILLLTFLFRHCRPLFEVGAIYAAQPPLYKVETKGGKDVYMLNDHQYETYIRKRAAELFDVSLSKDGETYEDYLAANAFSSFLSKAQNYPETIRATAERIGCNAQLVEFFADYGGYIGDTENTETFAEALTDAFPGLTTTVTQPGQFYLEGLYQNRFHAFYVDADLLPLVEPVVKAREGFGGYTMAYVLPKGSEEGEYLSISQAVAKVISAATPAHRQRFKGLGEMPAPELWDTTMNPATRSMLRITVADMEGTDDLIQRLMGNDPEHRKAFLETNQNLVKNLDV